MYINLISLSTVFVLFLALSFLFRRSHKLLPFTMSNNLPAAAKVIVEEEIGDSLPPGYYFLPSAAQLIEEYLLQKILDLPMASNIVKIMDFVGLIDPDQLNLGIAMI